APQPPTNSPPISTAPRVPLPTPSREAFQRAPPQDLFDNGTQERIQPHSFNRIQLSDTTQRNSRLSANNSAPPTGLDALLGNQRSQQQKETPVERKRYTVPSLSKAPPRWNVDNWDVQKKESSLSGSLDALVGQSTRQARSGKSVFNGGDTFVYDPNAPRQAPPQRRSGLRESSYSRDREGGVSLREGGYSRDREYGASHREGGYNREPREYNHEPRRFGGRDDRDVEPSKKEREEEAGAHSVTFSDMSIDRSDS